MNRPLVLSTAGRVNALLAVAMAPSFLCALIYGESVWPFVFAALVALGLGLPLWLLIKPAERRFQPHDGYAATALSWLTVVAVGSLPYAFSGEYDGTPLDCFFDSMASFTTTRAVIMADVESMPYSLILWRGTSNWIGGLGVLVLMLAIVGRLSAGGLNAFQAEATGGNAARMVPKLRTTARILYGIYAGLTALLFVCLLIAGMGAFDALIHAFGVAASGGFSTRNGSIGAFNSAAVEWVVIVFTVLFTIDFNCYFFILARQFKTAFKNEELWTFFGILIVAAAAVSVDLSLSGAFKGTGLVRHALFQTTAYISTSGYVTSDLGDWPTFSRAALFFLMAVGGMAGSTAGGVKIVRVVLAFKNSRAELSKMLKPNVVKTVLLYGKKVPNDTAGRVSAFFFLYFGALIVGTMLFSLEGLGIAQTLTTVVAMTSNIGAGHNLSGAFQGQTDFSQFSALSKITLSACMFMGRLEFFAVIMLFNPATWRGK